MGFNPVLTSEDLGKLRDKPTKGRGTPTVTFVDEGDPKLEYVENIKSMVLDLTEKHQVGMLFLNSLTFLNVFHQLKAKAEELRQSYTLINDLKSKVLISRYLEKLNAVGRSGVSERNFGSVMAGFASGLGLLYQLSKQEEKIETWDSLVYVNESQVFETSKAPVACILRSPLSETEEKRINKFFKTINLSSRYILLNEVNVATITIANDSIYLPQGLISPCLIRDVFILGKKKKYVWVVSSEEEDTALELVSRSAHSQILISV